MKLGLLVLTAGKQEGKLLEIKQAQFLVGRDPQCQLRPASPMISKRHCAVLIKGERAFIRDFGSTNGTYLNEERVEGERELKNDDQLKIGPIHFAVRLEVTKPSETPPPATKAAATTKPAAKSVDATPIPPAKPAKAPFVSSGDDDIDIASMLLDLDDGESPSSSLGSDGVPEGSTVMDLKVPEELLAAKPGTKEEGKPAAKSTTGDTRSAASKILDQMTRRPRNPS